MDSFEKYKKTVNTLVSKINGKFSNITFLTIDEILKEEINLRTIWWELSKIDDYSHKAYLSIQKELESLSEEDYDEWGYEIDNEAHDLNNLVSDKVMALQSLIDYLEKLEEINEDDEVLKNFSDIKSIEI